MQQHLRGEHARLDEADKAVRALFDAHARENQLWKEDTQVLILLAPLVQKYKH
jgi:hypothetical protein